MSSSLERDAPRSVLLEVGWLWLLTLLAIAAVVAVRAQLPSLVLAPGLDLADLVMVLVPVLFMYAPVWACHLRGADPWDYPMALPDFPWREPGEWMAAARWGLGLSVVILVPFVLGYHIWQIELVPRLEDALGVALYPRRATFTGNLPPDLAVVVLYHLFFVAIPEEMFYRGYLQTRLDELWPPRWPVLGATVGPGLLLTCVLFAFGHSLVEVQWGHVFIVVPSLGFGWLRAKTGGILAGAFFHAFCNVTVACLDAAYGIVPP